MVDESHDDLRKDDKTKGQHSVQKVEELATDLLSYFAQKNLDALQRCIRNSLEAVRRRIQASIQAQYGETGFLFTTGAV
jgi:hypothetical protein